MANHLGYIRLSPKIEDIDQRLDAFRQASSSVELFIERGIRGNVPLGERPQYCAMRSHLQSGDHLFIWWIDELGCEFDTCLMHLKSLLVAGVTVRTLSRSLTFKQNDPVTDALLTLIEGYAHSHHHRRMVAAEMGRRALKETPEIWKSKFRGRKRDDEKHQQVAKALFEGKTLQAVADETGVSISTVKRIKAKIKQNDELGQLRCRAHRQGTQSTG